MSEIRWNRPSVDASARQMPEASSHAEIANREGKIYQKKVDRTKLDDSFGSPTLKHLAEKADTENLLGSPITSKRDIEGNAYSFYEDGSVLITDEEEGMYHFLTAEGRAKGACIRQAAEAVISDDVKVEELKLLGKGKGGFSSVYSLETSDGSIAVKTSDLGGFLAKETSEALSSEDAQIPYDTASRTDDLFGVGPRAYVQKMSLQDTLELFADLDKHNIKRPAFYGFTLRKPSKDHEVQEFQFMEEIARPTVDHLMDTVGRFRGEHPEATEIDMSLFAHEAFIAEMIDSHYEGSFDGFIRDVARGYHTFVYGIKNKIWDIGDLEMDNIFVTGYDEENECPEFAIIDPIREVEFIRTRKQPQFLINKETKLLS